MAITVPTDIAAVLCWLDPSQGCYVERSSPSTPCGNGDPVGTWNARTGQVFTAPSDAARPTYRANGGNPYVDFDGMNDTLANTTISLDISTQESWLNARGTGSSFLDMGDGAQRLYYTGNLTASTTGSLYIKTGAFHESTNQYLSRYAFAPHGYTVSPGVAKFLLNGWESPAISSPWFNTWPAVGAKLGNGVAINSPFKGYMQDVVLCNAVLSAGNRSDLLSWLRTRCGTPLYDTQVMCCGDSLTAGYNSVDNFILNGWFGGDETHSYPYTVSTAKRSWKILNRGVTSKKIVDMTADDDTGVDPYFDATTFEHNVCVIWAGTNDLKLDDTSLATLQSRFTAYCNARTSAGWEVVAVEMMDRADFSAGQRTICGQFNTWLATQTGTLFSKLATLPAGLSGTSPWVGSPTLWDVDQTHLSRAGYQAIATPIQAAIQQIVGTGGGNVWSRSTLNPFNLSPFIL